MLSQFQIARVAADPAPVPRADAPGGWPGIVYCRLHGSPRIYSGYSAERLDAAAQMMRACGAPHTGELVHLRQHSRRAGDRECSVAVGSALTNLVSCSVAPRAGLECEGNLNGPAPVIVARRPSCIYDA